MSLTEICLRFGVAIICGGVLGFEREQEGKPAGLRTHMLVALGAAAFTLAAVIMAEGAVADGETEVHMQVDPVRVIQGVIGGIGFLGAGTIIRAGGSVQGITTAATIWVVGSVGIASGLGNYQLAIVTSVFAFVIVGLLGRIAQVVFPDEKPNVSPDSKSDHQEEAPPSSLAE